MKKPEAVNLMILVALCVTMAHGQHKQKGDQAATNGPAVPCQPDVASRSLPLVAIWKDSPSYRQATNDYRYLRIAVWEDGQVLLGRDVKTWCKDLVTGRISTQQVATLKQELRGTGVLDQKETCYLVPDGAVVCMTLFLDGKGQTLYWDEVELPLHGINYNPQPRHIAFKTTWKKVNAIAVSAVPSWVKPLTGGFSPPSSWYRRPATQSR